MARKPALLLLPLLLTASCGGRLPTTSAAAKIVRKHFNDYGKEYATSPFGGKKVQNVEILKMDEIHRHLVAIISFVTLEEAAVFKVRVVLEKGPLGWRMVHWENLGGG